MARHGMAWHGTAWNDTARHGMGLHGIARHGTTRHAVCSRSYNCLVQEGSLRDGDTFVCGMFVGTIKRVSVTRDAVFDNNSNSNHQHAPEVAQSTQNAKKPKKKKKNQQQQQHGQGRYTEEQVSMGGLCPFVLRC
jgi:hypothetical protein